MKLVEILVNHFGGEWPEDRCKSMCQDFGGVIWQNEETGHEDYKFGWSSVFYNDFTVTTTADDYKTAIVTKEIFEKFVEDQKVTQPKVEKFTEEFKKECVYEWDAWNDGWDSKVKFCESKGISPRSLNRWTELYLDEVRSEYAEEQEDFDNEMWGSEDTVEEVPGMTLEEFTDVKVGDKFIVVEDCGTFMEGAIVEFVGTRLDYCSSLFKLLEGDAHITCTAGNGIGAYTGFSSLQKYIEETPVSYMGTAEGITLYRGEESVTVHAVSSNYDKVIAAICDNDLQEAWINANLKEAIAKFSEGSITIDNGVVYSNGFRVVDAMANRLVQMLDEGADGIRKFCRFYESLLKVSDVRIIEELYSFLQHNDIILNEDGSFTGYKAVQENYKDKYTGQIDNSVGSVVEMPRHLVNDNKDQTCSAGLHVGSIEYVQMYGSGITDRIIKVKVWPSDVVSVPTDYNGQKLRACKYEVVEDVTSEYK